MNTPRNIDDVRAGLAKTFGALMAKKIKPAQAKAVADVAREINSGIKAELVYASLRREAPTIPFLDYRGKRMRSLTNVTPRRALPA